MATASSPSPVCVGRQWDGGVRHRLGLGLVPLHCLCPASSAARPQLQAQLTMEPPSLERNNPPEAGTPDGALLGFEYSKWHLAGGYDFISNHGGQAAGRDACLLPAFAAAIETRTEECSNLQRDGDPSRALPITIAVYTTSSLAAARSALAPRWWMNGRGSVGSCHAGFSVLNIGMELVFSTLHITVMIVKCQGFGRSSQQKMFERTRAPFPPLPSCKQDTIRRAT
ncbi:hypothetical protein PG995_014378 [Apiospora arundinis]